MQRPIHEARQQMKVIGVVDTAGQGRPLRALNLREGQRLAALVLRDAKPGGKALLSLAGSQISVTTRTRLHQGEALELTVHKTGKQIVLSRQTDTGAAARTTLTRGLLNALNKAETAAGHMMATRPDHGGATRPPSATGATSTAARPSSAAVSQASAPHTTQPLAASAAGRVATPPSSLTATAARSATTSSEAATPTNRMPPPAAPPAGHAATGPTAAHAARLPPQLLQLIPQAEQLRTAAGVAQLLARSGLFAERHVVQAARSGAPQPLAAPTAGSTPDLKLLLRQAAAQILNANHAAAPAKGGTTSGARPGGMAGSSPFGAPAAAGPAAHGSAGQAGGSTLEATLNLLSARIDASQIKTALHQFQGQSLWLIDVPIRFDEDLRRLRMAIREEDPATQGASSGWQVDFEIAMPGLGPLHSSLYLTGDELDVRLYAEQAGTRQLLTGGMVQLEAGLRRSGVTPRHLAVYPGPPPKAVQQRLDPEPPQSGHAWRV